MQKVLSCVLIVLLVVFVGCKKDESSTGPATTAASVPKINFSGPNTTSTDVNATRTKGDALTMNGVMSAGTAFASVPAQQNGSTSTWTYGSGGITYTFTGVQQSDGSYAWTLTLNGIVGSTNYSNFKIWDGTSSADGKNGSWTFYEPGHTAKTDALVYSTDANGVLTGTWYIYDSSGTLSEKLVIVNNKDGSGQVVEYFNSDVTIMSYKSVWAANGSGTWYIYNSSGVQTSTGTWQ
jgi:hypothetical protein